MNKIKKSAAELRKYLGRDEQGIRLLEVICRQSNALRKEAAAASEQTSELRELVAANITQFSVLEQALADCKNELSHKQNLLRQKEVQIKSLQGSVDELETKVDALIGEPPVLSRTEKYKSEPGVVDDVDNGTVKSESDLPPLLQSYPKFARLLKRLRREMPLVPKPFRRGDLKVRGELTGVSLFHLEDFATSYSHESFHVMGMFAMCHALTFGSCGFYSKLRWKDTAVDMMKIPDGQQRRLWLWFGTNNVEWRTAEDRLRDQQTNQPKNFERPANAKGWRKSPEL